MEEQQSADKTAAELVWLRESFKLNLDKISEAFDMMAVADQQARANADEILSLQASLKGAHTHFGTLVTGVRPFDAIS